MGRRGRQRQKLAAQLDDSHAADQPARTPSRRAREQDYTDDEGNVLTLRGSLTPASRVKYNEVLAGGLDREDAWQRATELLFEHLAVSWTIAGLAITRQKELLMRYRMASSAEREFVRNALREHLAEHFPELRAP